MMPRVENLNDDEVEDEGYEKVNGNKGRYIPEEL